MPVSRITPSSWMYTDGNDKVQSDDIIKKAGGYYKVYPNGLEELIHCLKTIGDVQAVISTVTNHADGTYPDSTALSFSFLFSEVVTVDTLGGTPSVQVYTEAGVLFDLNYASGTGTNTLVFTGTPTGIADGTLVIVEEIQLNGGIIKDSANQAINNDFPADYVQPSITMTTV